MSQTEFVPGQRWISNTEVDLGLGIVVESANRRVEISFPAAGEVRTYAIDNAPLSRVCYEADEEIYSDEGVVIQVRERIEHNGCFIYLGEDAAGNEVILPELHLDSAVHFSKPQERLFAGQIDRHGLFKLRVETLEHRHRLEQSPAYGLLGARVALLPHQLYIAAELASRPVPRALLADEVGLGKTIEAGMILHQRLISERARRVLILLPDSLLHQWLVEMHRRFNLTFSLLDAERCEALQASGHDNPFESAQRVISPVSLMTRDAARLEQAVAAGWDLLVVDEAHHLGWSREVVSHAYHCVERLAQRSEGLLLLTATPEQLGPEGHYARLRLLDPERYPDLDRFLEQEQQYFHLNHLIGSLLEGGAAFLRQDRHTQRELAARLGEEAITHWLAAPALSQDNLLDRLIHQLVDQQGTGRVLFRNTRRTVEGFPARRFQGYPLLAPNFYAPQGADVQLEPLLHPERHLGTDWISVDPRVAWLQDWLKQHRRDKVLVICAHAETAVALDEYLSLRLGVRSSVFHEGMSLVNRDRSAAYFADQELGAQVLICSEIGSEGRNFQFCHHLVLFDLPLSPDLLEQRIGRLDRIGQTQDVQIHLPYYRQSPTDVLMQWYHQGLNAFERVCAVGDALYQRFAQPLHAAMHQPEDAAALESLLHATQEAREALEQELAEGRDRLLEMSSFNAERADQVLQAMQSEDDVSRIQTYAERLFDRFGISLQPHGRHGLVLHPGEHMLCQLAELPEEGMTLTFSREEALQREEIEFMSWEHPLMIELMEMLTHNEMGNNAICMLKLPALPPGTLLLEAIYELNLTVPRALQLPRYLPGGYVRLLLDSEGRDLSEVLGHQPLNQLAQPLKLSTSQNMVRMVRDKITVQLQQAQQLADARLPVLRETALQTLSLERDAAYQRLEALARVNPAVDEAELEAHRLDTRTLQQGLQNARLRLDAVRVIVVAD
ncbi:RNA polymerase-associated protein RapA [Nitrincola lacisaponensis]|uniref:RNA polymerase-associated protein RapA n=1 Tax=Nitrincola lacisaponensis TaxID=267850 RepID=UPI00055A7182|nr:RNA polymerase-associated protein RapA [Nitrincola lacisaponensis]